VPALDAVASLQACRHSTPVAQAFRLRHGYGGPP
jgi:hypothetical protein